MSSIYLEGLRSLMQKENYDAFLKNFQLGPGPVVIDANSVSERLYSKMRNRLDIFGGNYDCYVRELKYFFDKLKEIEIKPYVIFLGGYYRQPDIKVRDHTDNAARQMVYIPYRNEKYAMYPLCIREVFLNEVVRRRLIRVQLDFKELMPLILIAKRLNAPVLGFDTQYYLYDIRYIPVDAILFESPESRLVSEHGSRQKKLMKYYPARIFKPETLLKFFCIKNKHLLPVLIALLGNDDLSHDKDYRLFLQSLGIKVRNEPRIKYNELLARWLKTTDMAHIRTIIESMYVGEARRYIWEDIQRIVTNYSEDLSKYLRHLSIDSDGLPDELHQLFNPRPVQDSAKFVNEKILKCEYPPGFVDLIHLRKYYLFENIELFSLTNSHGASLEIITVIFSILRNEYEKLLVYLRTKNASPAKVLPIYKFEIPNLMGIQSMNVGTRRKLLRDILVVVNVEEVDDFLREVPEDWKLLLIAMKHYTNYKRRWALMYAIILCKIVLTTIDPLLGGFYRNQEYFKQTFQEIPQVHVEHPDNLTIKTLLEKVSKEEGLRLMEKVVHLFQVDPDLLEETVQLNKELVLVMLEFQSCLLHVDYLNTLLNYPYEKVDYSKIINSTFIYNCANHMIKTERWFKYIADILGDRSSTVFRIMKGIVDHLDRCCYELY